MNESVLEVETIGGMPINEVIRRYPQSLALFKELGIDTCCGGALPLSQVALRHGLELNAVIDTLARLRQHRG